ncbi:hypothetical protein DFS34DRAFT_645831 [Phlyctochytrium arcticum]|nr:hypothetical protein DFS34DRAFT_645831 [Phlyctochytrium arcticum]
MADGIKSKFITEAEVLAEQKANGTEGKEDPIPEVHDPRPLFERLAERRAIAEEEFAEKIKFSNLVYRIDEEESRFLTAHGEEDYKRRKQIAAQEREQLEVFRKAVAESNVITPESPAKLLPVSSEKTEAARTTTPKKRRSGTSASNLLQGVVVKRRKAQKGDAQSAPATNSSTDASDKGIAKDLSTANVSTDNASTSSDPKLKSSTKTSDKQRS